MPAPTDGSVKFTDDRNNNSQASFSCNAGFTLVQGDKVRVCRINNAKDAGFWNKQSPKCLGKQIDLQCRLLFNFLALTYLFELTLHH